MVIEPGIYDEGALQDSALAFRVAGDAVRLSRRPSMRPPWSTSGPPGGSCSAVPQPQGCRLLPLLAASPGQAHRYHMFLPFSGYIDMRFAFFSRRTRMWVLPILPDPYSSPKIAISTVALSGCKMQATGKACQEIYTPPLPYPPPSLISVSPRLRLLSPQLVSPRPRPPRFPNFASD